MDGWVDGWAGGWVDGWMAVFKIQTLPILKHTQ